MTHDAKVLVASCDPDACLSLVQDLMDRGYNTHGVLNGHDGVHRLDGTFDAVVADLSLPRSDCIGILQRAKRLCANAVRIMLAGSVTKDITVEMLNHGAQFLIEEPFTSQQVSDAISQLLAERRERFDADVHRVCQTRLNGMALNERERQVIICLLMGLPLKDVGVKLGMLEGSTKNLVSRLYKKIGISTRNELFQLLYAF